MLFSELCGKIILEINTGMILGSIEDADLLLDELTGKIDAMLLPAQRNRYSRKKIGDDLLIHWYNIKSIGPEIIVIDINRDIIPL